MKKPLKNTYTRKIGVEIGEKIAVLHKLLRQIEILKKQKAEGKEVVEHWTKRKSIKGIPIKYVPRCDNLRIYYEADINEPDDVFNAKMKMLMEALKDYKPIRCKRFIKAEIGEGAVCDDGSCVIKQ